MVLLPLGRLRRKEPECHQATLDRDHHVAELARTTSGRAVTRQDAGETAEPNMKKPEPGDPASQCRRRVRLPWTSTRTTSRPRTWLLSLEALERGDSPRRSSSALQHRLSRMTAGVTPRQSAAASPHHHRLISCRAPRRRSRRAGAGPAACGNARRSWRRGRGPAHRH